MAQINLKKITFSNLLSYGATETVIDIQNGMNWIRGSNGYGKSTIIEAINFALFGKAYRDISLPGLVNNYNQKRLMVQLELERIIAGESRTFIIRRGLKPKKFEIYKGEVHKDNRLDEEGKAGIFQSYLETEILGFNETLFKQTIAMSAMSSTPFLEMGKADKRKFIEAILGVSDIEKIKKAFGSELSDLKSEFLKISSKIPERQSKLEELEELLDNALNEKKDDIQSLKDEITDIEKKIVAERENTVELIKDRDAKKEQGKVVADEYDEYKNVKTDISAKSADVKNAKELIEKNTQKIAKVNESIDELSKYTDGGLDELKDKAKRLKKELASIDELKELRLTYKHAIDTSKAEIKKLKKHLEDHSVGVPCDRCQRPYTENDYGAIKQSVDADISKYNDIINRNAIDYEEVDEKIGDLEKKATEYSEVTELGISYKAKLIEYKTAIDTLKSSKDEIAECESKIETLNSELEILEGKVSKADILNASLTKLRTEFLEAKSAVQLSERNVSNFEQTIETIQGKIADRESKKIDDVIAKTEAKIESTKQEIKSGKESVTEVSNEIEILQYIVKMFGDEGIKEYMIKKYIPVLNKSIDKVLKSFGVPFTIAFDSSMDHTFDNSFGLAKEYKALSEGQKRRMNFSIYIAFREFVNKIGRFTINTLFLDEILDTAMDDSGLEDMIGIIKSKVNDLGSVYLISHKMNSLNEEFENILEVKFDGTFSTLEKV